MNRFILAFVLPILIALFSSPLRAEDILLKHASVVDPAQRTISTQNLLIHKGRIQLIKTIPKQFKGKIFDLTGKWIIPGMTDTHDHSMFGNPGPAGSSESLTTSDVAKRMLYAGVTSFWDLFGDEKKLFEFRKLQHAGKAEGAQLYAAGPMLTCEGCHGTEFGIPTRTMQNAKEARQQVDALAKENPDFVKIAYDHARKYPSLDRPTMEAIILEAKRKHLKTIVHIGTWKDAREAVLAGATVITHLFEADIPDDLVALMKKHRVWEIPTMTYQQDLLNILEERSLLNSPLLSELITPALLQAYREISPTRSYVGQMLNWQAKGRETYPRTLVKLDKAGVPLMAGTDSGDLGTFQGYSLHRELVLFVKAGLSPWTALAAGTTLPKKFLGKPSGISDRQLADLVVLGGSPIDDIQNTQKVEMVFQQGKWVDRAALLPRTVSNSPGGRF